MKIKAKNPPDELANPQSPTNAKSSDGKPLAGRSPVEVDRALYDRNLPEEQILAICSHASPASKSETKNKARNQKQASNHTSFGDSPSPAK